MRKIYPLIIAAVSVGPLFPVAAAQKNPEQQWRSAIFKCVNEEDRSRACPLKVYEQELLDPSDQFSLYGDSDLNAGLSKQTFRTTNIGISSPNGLSCQTAKTGIPIKCAIASRDIKGGLLSDLVPDSDRFVVLGAPYNRKINEPLKLKGRKYLSHGFGYDVVDDYWRDWVKFENLTEAEQIATSGLLSGLLRDPPHCQGDRGCKRYDLLRTPDGVGVIGICGHVKIGESIGPPDPKTCRPEFAFSDDNVWVLATVKAVPSAIGGCMRCAMCCRMQMGRFGDFASMGEEDAFRKKYEAFIMEVVKRLRSSLQTAPWAFSSVEFNAQSGDFRAVSNRRRSSIIDGFEDLYLSFQPIVRPKKDASNRSAVETRFLKMEQKDTMASVLIPTDSAGLYVSVHLEIYVSKYNTVDDDYWIKPSREQEQQFKDKLSTTLDDAFEGSCKALGFRWEGQESGAPRCLDPAG
jgi:hypothetical protein